MSVIHHRVGSIRLLGGIVVTIRSILCRGALGKSLEFLDEKLVPLDVADDLPRTIYSSGLCVHVFQLGILPQFCERESHQGEKVQVLLYTWRLRGVFLSQRR
jgi:hypothetical protein